MVKLKDHQLDMVARGVDIVNSWGIVYIAGEMRVGKTLVSMSIAERLKKKRMLFVTIKKNIEGVQADYRLGEFTFDIDVINYEQLHNYKSKPDIVIVDETHKVGAYPKPSLRTKRLKQIVGSNDMVLLSGTPTPESYSQIYHQLWISEKSPFKEFKNFYKWAKEFVNVKQTMRNGYYVNDYSNAKQDLIEIEIKHLFVTKSQKEAGFKNTEIIEEVQYIDMDKRIYKLADMMVKDRYYEFKDGDEIVCDSAVKLQQKLHQVFSGTIITERNEYRVLDKSKAEYIVSNYKPPFAIYYKYKSEGDILRKMLVNWTENPYEFNEGRADIFLSQVRSGALGINLSRADLLIAYNIDFSAELYWQMRARIQARDKDRKNKLVWLFAKNGIEDKIYKAVQNKKNYTLRYFKKDFVIN